jgi:hypothetical protein
MQTFIKYLDFFQFMNLKDLDDIVAKFEYGQFNILDNGMTIQYNLKDQQVKFDPFYHYDFSSTKGSCSELTLALYLEIREKYPELHVIRVKGNDPEFFVNPSAAHYFLLASPKDLMDGQEIMIDSPEIKKVVSKNPLILDPSFHKVIPFRDSGYMISALFNQGCEIHYSHSLVLPSKLFVPLGFDSKKQLVYLTPHLDSPNIIAIGIQAKNNVIRKYDLDLESLDKEFKGETKILEFLHLLRQREKTLSDDKFVEGPFYVNK